MSADVAGVLRNAKALIDTPEKWYRPGVDIIGRSCLMGAIREAERRAGVVDDSQFSEREAARIFVRAIRGIGPGFFAIPEWNDAPERTHDEVMAAFDAAIALAEAEGV